MQDGILLAGGRGANHRWGGRGPLTLKRIVRASTLLDTVHGAQGDFGRRSRIVATMTYATGLHASEIVPLEVKDVRKFETKIVNTIWGPSPPGRAREIFFCLLCPGQRMAPTMLIINGRSGSRASAGAGVPHSSQHEPCGRRTQPAQEEAHWAGQWVPCRNGVGQQCQGGGNGRHWATHNKYA